MNDAQRLGIFGVFLVGLWIVTYWLTDRPHTPDLAVSFGEPPASIEVELPPEPPAATNEPAPSFARVAQPDADIATPPAPGTVVPPSYRIYKVQAGDTAPIISRKFYGTDIHWKAVQWANPLTDFNKLKVGREIRVPVDPANVEGLVVPEPGQPPKAASNQPADTTQYVEYIVEAGDTLTEIARSLYGKTKYWTVIRDANRDQVNEEGTNLRKGMTLRIPPLPVAN